MDTLVPLSDVMPRFHAAFAPEPAAVRPISRLARVSVAAACITLLGASFASARLDVYGFSLLVVTALASWLQVRLPGTASNLSAGAFLIPLCIFELGTLPAVSIAGLVALVQAYRQRETGPGLLRGEIAISSSIVSAFVAESVLAFLTRSGIGCGPGVTLPLLTCVYFTLSTVPIAAAAARRDGGNALSLWRQAYAWTLPHQLIASCLLAYVVTLASQRAWPAIAVVLVVLALMFRSVKATFLKLEADKKQAENIAKLHVRTVEALALAIEAKDHSTNDHLRRVRIYAVEIAKELKLSKTDVEALETAAMLHDIGKLAVPEHIICKPGRLTPEEFDRVKIHPIVGAQILESVEFDPLVVEIVAAHHERWDGTGYPAGLAGDAIPLGARILSAVDCLDALSSDRQYRRALPLNEAMRLVKAQAGSAFDPQVIEILDARCVELDQMARARRSRSRVNTEVKTVPGAAPAAGFAKRSELPQSRAKRSPARDFVASIAAARREVQIVFEMSQALGTSLCLADTLSMLTKRLQGAVPHDTAAVYLLRNGALKAEYVSGVDQELFSELFIPPDQGVSGWVISNRKPLINADPAVEPGYLNEKNRYTTLQAALAVPLESVTGPIGVLTLYHNQRDFFTPDHLRLLLAISSKLAIAIENSVRYQQAEANATNDFLTGLPNGRSLFVYLEQEIAKCKRTGGSISVLVCDLDGFKQVNDRFGHLEGNRILRTVGDRLTASCRAGDYVARMGGDEFVIVLSGTPQEQIPAFAERTRQSIARISVEEYSEPLLNASIGWAALTPEITSPEELLAIADRNMYAVKRAHKEQPGKCTGRSVDYLAAGTSFQRGSETAVR